MGCVFLAVLFWTSLTMHGRMTFLLIMLHGDAWKVDKFKWHKACPLCAFEDMSFTAACSIILMAEAAIVPMPRCRAAPLPIPLSDFCQLSPLESQQPSSFSSDMGESALRPSFWNCLSMCPSRCSAFFWGASPCLWKRVHPKSAILTHQRGSPLTCRISLTN